MKNAIVLSSFFIISLLSFTDLAAQSYKGISVYSAEGVRSAVFTGLVEVSDGSMAMGHIDTFFNGQYGTGRIWVVKLNQDGSVKWSRFYSDMNASLPWWGRRLAKADNDGVYILAENQAKNGFILKLDKNGDVLWNKKTIVMPNNAWVNDLITTPDEGCLAVGYTITSDTGAYVKYYKDGSVAFSGKYLPQNANYIRFCGVDNAFDGGYHMVGIEGEYDPYPVWKTHLLVNKINANGQLIWSKFFNGGDETSGDKKKSEGYTISAIPGGGFIAGGLMYKESILNGQAYIIRGKDNGDTLWTKNLFEELYPYPGVGARNSINRVIVKDNEIYSEFVECSGCSTEKNYLVSMNIGNGEVQWKQTGYKISDQHTRSLNRIMANGQPSFIGGEYYLDLPKHGLILWTTPDGLWIPPSIVKFEGGVYEPELITRIDKHIQVKRVVQVSPDINFSSIVYEQANIIKDTVKLNLSNLDDAKYYLRVGITGGKGYKIWSDTLEFLLFSTLHLRMAEQVPVYSSEYGGGWAASQIIGLPDVYPNYGDKYGAWSSSTQDAQREFVECTFSSPKPISGLIIFETYNPGAIDTIYVRNPNTQEWEIVYSISASAAPAISRALGITFPATAFPVSAVRLAINSPAVPGYNEIDAIGLIDATGVGTTEILRDYERLQIIPNPSPDQIVISWDIPLRHDADCFLSSIVGQQLRYSKVPAGSTMLTWAIDQLPCGSYWVSLRQGENVQSQLFLKE